MNYQASLKIYYLLSSLNTVGQQIFSGILYVYLLHSNFNMAQIGIYMSLFWLISTLTEIVGGLFVDRYGSMNSLLVSYVLRIMGFILLIYNFGILGLLLSAVFSGIAESFASGTLSTWIINKTKNQNENSLSTQKITSKNDLIRNFTSLFAAFVGTELLYNIDKKLPLIVSAIVYSILLILVLFINKFEKTNTQKYEIKAYKGFYQTIQELKELIKDFVLYPYLWVMLLVSVLVDVGPSDQWQILFYQNDNVQGYTIVFFNIIGIVTNFLLIKLSKKYQDFLEQNIPLLLSIDVLLTLLIATHIFSKEFFYLHVFLYGIIMSKLFVFLNDKFVQKGMPRATIVSIYFMAESLFTSILLAVNGYLSDLVGYLNTWIMFDIVAIIFLIIYMLNRHKNSIKI